MAWCEFGTRGKIGFACVKCFCLMAQVAGSNYVLLYKLYC